MKNLWNKLGEQDRTKEEWSNADSETMELGQTLENVVTTEINRQIIKDILTSTRRKL